MTDRRTHRQKQLAKQRADEQARWREVLMRHWMDKAGIPMIQRPHLTVIYVKGSERMTFERIRANPLSDHLKSGLIDIAQHQAAVNFSDLYAIYMRASGINMERTGGGSPQGDMTDKRLDAMQRLHRATEAIAHPDATEVIRQVACEGQPLRDIRGRRPQIIQDLYLYALDRLARHFGLA